MFSSDNHWKIWTFSVLQRKSFFKKLDFHFLVESTKIENVTFPYKTALSEANVNPNKVNPKIVFLGGALFEPPSIHVSRKTTNLILIYRKILLISPPKYKPTPTQPHPPPPPPNIGPSNLSFVRIYAQGVLTGFYGKLDKFAKQPV